MKALILNSGLGSRMGVLTSEHPKCMTEISPRETILSRQLKQIADAGIREVVITTGLFRDALIAYCESLDLPLSYSFIHNPAFRETNYIYSIYCARAELDDDILLMHGDLVFENEVLDKPNFQGNAAVNYTDAETPWTRIIEHKWFEFGKDEDGDDLPKTVISREYSSEWKPGDEPYYPVNDAKNGKLYEEYKKLAEKEAKVIFGGRLGEYKYYDMDQVIGKALETVK